MLRTLLALAQGVEHTVVIFFVLGYFASRALYNFLLSKLQLYIQERTSRNLQATCSKGLSESISGEDSSATLATGLACPLPADLCGRIATHCGFQDVGVLGACCKTMQTQFWDSQEVWLALSTAMGLPSAMGSDLQLASSSECWNCAGRAAREAYRRAAFRTDLTKLRSLAKVGRPQAILDEAAHVACGLLPDDLPLLDLAQFVEIASRSLGAHDPESPKAIASAERLLRAARRHMELFTEEQLENLEYAYKSVHQLHSLMLSSMKDSYQDTLEQSFWSVSSVLADDQEFREFLELCRNDEICEPLIA